MNTKLTTIEWRKLFEPEQFIVQELEKTILHLNLRRDRYKDIEAVLRIRKNILDYYALRHQAELLPAIVEFNDLLKENLRKMYDKTWRIWNGAPHEVEDGALCRLEAICYLDSEYPALHPVQTPEREELWEILTDASFNPLYSSGVSFGPLTLTGVSGQRSAPDSLSFDEFIGFTSPLERGKEVTSPPENWNEGLDPGLTKDLHLIAPFHHLFGHTCFALTDFLYVRRFNADYQLEWDESVSSRLVKGI